MLATIMCGIFGHVGARGATEPVMAGLKTLDYRGHDSWGITTREDGANPGLLIDKHVGRIGLATTILTSGTVAPPRVPPQVLAYELAILRGLDPDKPPNLAKSVTVR